MNILKQPIFIGMVVIALVIAVIWNFVSSKPQKTNTTETQTKTEQQEVSNLTNITSSDFDPITRKELEIANAKAIEAKADNLLAAIEINIGSDLQAAGVNTRYIYNAKSDPKNNWMITVSQNSGSFIRALVPKDDYIGEVPTMNTKLWKYNYVTALQLAEKNGGLSWRESNTLTGVKLTLRHSGEKNWLLWIVEYSGSSANLTIKLDANSGKVVE